MSSEPVISVIIPALNEEKYIKKCLRALKAQKTNVPFEILVVDNCSTDATAAIAAREDAMLLKEIKQSVCAARQRGSFAARGDILVSTDADTVVPEDWLSKIYDTFTARDDVVAVAGPFRFERSPRWGSWYSALLFSIVRFFSWAGARIVYAPATNFAFRRKAFHAIGGYMTHLTQGGDEYDLLRRLRSQGSVVYRHDNCVLTSSRRVRKGILYNFFVTFLWYYCAGYLAGRCAGRPIIGSYPAFREERNANGPYQRWILTVAIMVLFLYALSVHHMFGMHTISWSHFHSAFSHRNA